MLIGIGVAALLVALMLILRRIGEGMSRRDETGMTWRGVLGRVFAKTSLPFMIFAAADVVATYAELPHKPERLLHIAFGFGQSLLAIHHGGPGLLPEILHLCR